MNNTKQLLIAAVAASMNLNAIADISISGAAKVNAKGGDYAHEADITIIGKSGDTSVVAQIGLDNSNEVEQLYMTSKVAGIDVRAGRWKSGKGELGKNGGNLVDRISATTSFGGIKLTYQDFSEPDGTSAKISGSIAGVALSYKAKGGNTSETTAAGSMGGVNASFHTKDNGASADATSVVLSTSVQGVSITYVDIDAAGGTSMDGFFGAQDGVSAATGLGLSTSIAGNKVTFKALDIDMIDINKLIINRKLASGATFEAIYEDAPYGDSLDLELAVKF